MMPTDPIKESIVRPAEQEDTQRADDASAIQNTEATCPECNGRIVTDAEHGDTACEDCGLILGREVLDRGPEWRAFNATQEEERRRVGKPTTQLLHDKGLSTMIGWQNKDGYGNSIPSKQRARLARLRTWDERFRTKNPQERNLKHGLGEIERMASALDLSKDVRETACVIYRRAVDEDLLPGRSIESMATASLYGSARQLGLPRSLAEFATVSRVEKLSIQRAYRYISRELSLEIKPTDPVAYVPQFASILEVSTETEQVARDLLEMAKEHKIHSGKSPSSLAAAALYAATHLTNEALTQATVSDATHVSKVTIRNRYPEILEVGEDQVK